MSCVRISAQIGVVLPSRRQTVSRCGRHERQALTPERGVRQVVGEKVEQGEPGNRHHPNGEVNRLRLGPGDMPPAGRNVELSLCRFMI